MGLAIGSFLLAISTFAYLSIETTSRSLGTSVSQNRASATGLFTGRETGKPATPAQGAEPNGHISRSSLPSENKTASPFTHSGNQHKEMETGTGGPGLNTSDGTTQTVSAFSPTVVDDYPGQVSLASTSTEPNSAKPLTYPLTIESVVNSYRPSLRKKRLSFQFYFTPTTSYRKLSENKSFLRSQSPTNPNYAPALIFDVNNVVTHRPDLGFETGMSAKYALTSRMKLLGGLQFNVNRYNIRAYNAVTSVATIMFNGRRNNRADSLNAVTSFSNISGYKTDWLQNYYLQISAPVGVEFTLAGNDKVQFGLGTTIQPTYVLGDRAYLISTDYKSYAEVPQLVRRWNVNTALATFVGYSTGRLAWQVGPQVRYQLLSSFIDKYPVKENLFDFGLKVGISVNK